jgi:hypothetical protein
VLTAGFITQTKMKKDIIKLEDIGNKKYGNQQ